MSRAPNWRPDEDALLDRRIPDSEVSRLTGRELNAIWLRRCYLRKKGRLSLAPAPKAPPMAATEQLLHPQYAKPRTKEVKVSRACLRCRRDFTTTRFVRVCGPCKKTDDWS